MIKLHKIDLVLVGPEEPLTLGIVNFLTKNKVKVFGPSKYAARLEGSKAFMKKYVKKIISPLLNFEYAKIKDK